MNNFLKVFCEENWLQVADHLITILFGVASFILAVLAIRLTKKDKAKTIAINELQAQTKKLEEMYLYQIQPRFVAIQQYNSTTIIKNYGGDCFNLQISLAEGEIEKYGDIFEKWGDNFSSMTEKTVSSELLKNDSFIFTFNDRFGNRFEQILDSKTKRFSNLKKMVD